MSNETTVKAFYLDRDGKVTGRRNAVATRYVFSRTHEDGHKYSTEVDAGIGIKPPKPIEIQAINELDRYLRSYNTHGNNSKCTHPWKKLQHGQEEYSGSRCTICGIYLKGTGAR